MDEMKIKISTRFMKGIIAKIIAKSISKKFGFKPEIRIHDIDAEMKNGRIRFHIDVEGSMDEKAFVKIYQLIDED